MLLMPNLKESVFYSNNSEHTLQNDGTVYAFKRETVIEMLMPNLKEIVFYSNNSEHILHN